MKHLIFFVPPLLTIWVVESFLRCIWLESLMHTHTSNVLGQLASIDDRYHLISIRIGSYPTHLCNTNLCPVLIQVRTIAIRIMFGCNACFGIKNTYSTAPETFFCSHLWNARSATRDNSPFCSQPRAFFFYFTILSFVNINTK